MSSDLTAKQFIQELDKHRASKGYVDYEGSLKADETDQFIDVGMGEIFGVAKRYTDMPLSEIELLLDSTVHDYRVGAVTIMDYKARRKLTDDQRQALFDLYIRRHDRINSWDLVDRSAIHVLGDYLQDKPRDILYKLAKSKHPYERRSAIVATLALSAKGDSHEAFRVAELMLTEQDRLGQRAVGWGLRVAGGKELLQFLEKHAAIMPRPMLTNAIEKLTPEQKRYYRALQA